MPEPTMTLSEDQLNQIGNYVQANLPIWLRNMPPQTVQIADPVLLERVVHVDDELKAQRELMNERFDANDKRFDELIRHSNERFDANDKRFDELIRHFNERFDANDKRFDDLIRQFNERFDDLIRQSDERFKATDKRFDDLIHSNDKRFDDLMRNNDKRFEDMNRRFTHTQWLVGILVTVFMGLSTALQLM